MDVRSDEAIGGDAVLLGDSRRGRRLAVVGAALAAAAVATMAASSAYDVFGGAALTAGIVGALLVMSGIVDSILHEQRRRAWASAGAPVWHPDVGTDSYDVERRSRLESTSRAWDLLLGGAAVSALVAWTLAVHRSIGAVGAMRTVLLASAVVTALVVAVVRRSRGKIVLRVIFPRSGLRPGAEAAVTVMARTTGVELPPEAFAFGLRCVRVQSPAFWFFARCETLATVEPLARRSMAGMETAWRLTFSPPDDLPAADLLAAEPVYWELAIEALGPGSACRAAFVAPVLAQSRPVTGEFLSK